MKIFLRIVAFMLGSAMLVLPGLTIAGGQTRQEFYEPYFLGIFLTASFLLTRLIDGMETLYVRLHTCKYGAVEKCPSDALQPL